MRVSERAVRIGITCDTLALEKNRHVNAKPFSCDAFALEKNWLWKKYITVNMGNSSLHESFRKGI